MKREEEREQSGVSKFNEIVRRQGTESSGRRIRHTDEHSTQISRPDLQQGSLGLLVVRNTRVSKMTFRDALSGHLPVVEWVSMFLLQVSGYVEGTS